MTVRTVSDPVYEPVSLAEAKDWCNVGSSDGTTFDAVLTLLIAAMRRYAENLTGRAFIQRSLQLILPYWPADGVIELPYPPLAEVTSIQYIDTDGTVQTLAADQYVVHTWREPGMVVPEYLVSWPSLRGVPNAVQVNYMAGYAAVGSPQEEAENQAGQPQTVKLWMHARLATLFENREQIVVGSTVADLPRAYVDGILDELVVHDRVTG